MSHYLVILRSLTYAQRAERLLERAGIYSSVKKAPQSDSAEGCAYGVVVRSKNIEDVRLVLAQNHIAVKSVVEYGAEEGAAR